MCGRFAQAQSREEYLAHLVEASERDIAWDPAPIGRYNVAPGTKVLLLNERDEQLHLDAVYWGYAPGWWDKPPLINARVETTPELLDQMVREVLIGMIDGKYEEEVVAWRFLQPGRPNPTHRYERVPSYLRSDQ